MATNIYPTLTEFTDPSSAFADLIVEQNKVQQLLSYFRPYDWCREGGGGVHVYIKKIK